MNWLNIHTSTLRSSTYLGTSLHERAVWLQLLSYCVDQENGGRLEGAVHWKNSQWLQSCGVTARDVKQARGLLTIEGEDVCVKFFPLDKQIEVQEKRAAGKRGGSARTEEKVAAARQNGALGGRPSASPKTQAEREVTQCRNPSKNPTEGERNRKGRELEGERNVRLLCLYSAASTGNAAC